MPTNRLSKFLKSLLGILKKLAFWTFILGLVLGAIFSPNKFYYQQYFSSTFDHPNFNDEGFRQRFEQNKTYTYIDDGFLKTSVMNNFPQGLGIQTKLILPEYMSYTCYVENSQPWESCNDYVIEGNGGIRRVYFNITVENTPKTEDTITLKTSEKTSHFFGLLHNEKLTELKIIILE